MSTDASAETTASATTEPVDVEPDEAGHDEHGHGEHKPDAFYIKVAAVLAVITALEVAWSYLDVGPLFLPGLLLMMGIKFVAVVSIFMHLRFDKKIFTWSFYSGLFLAIGVYIVMFAAFQAFG